MAVNPYEAPLSRVDDAPGNDDDADRRAHLRREAAIRTTGVAWGVVALAMVAGGVSGLFVEMANGGRDRFGVGLAVWLVVAGLVGLLAAGGLATLRPRAKAPAAIGAFFALPLCFFIVVLGFCATLVLAPRGRRVLAADYAGPRARTSHLLARSQPGEAIAVVALLALHVLALVGLGLLGP